jgi:hypothetical protein
MNANFAALHNKKPREKAGAQTASRFEFQANFSILKMLELHEAGFDFRALFDHFDDLSILNSSTDPSGISFFQIKGRSNEQSWTIKQIAKEDKGATPPRSIVGKMYKNAADFSTATDRIVFASNASFALRLKDETKTNADNHAIAGRDLHPSELQLIDAALEVDFPSPRKPDCSVPAFRKHQSSTAGSVTFCCWTTGRFSRQSHASGKSSDNGPL